MVEKEKELGIMDLMKDGLSYVVKIISSNLLLSVMTEGVEMVENKIIQIEKRILKKICSFLTISFGSMFLIFAFFFFLVENLSWTKTASFFLIGTIIFVIGLLLKLSESKER